MAHYEDCKFFMRGACTRGLHCGFRHSEAASKTELICQEWAIGKWCNGDCNLRHPSALELGALAAAAAAAAATSRPKTTPGYSPSAPPPCKFYAKGRCTKGESCPFLHADQPARPAPTSRSPQISTISLRAAAAIARSSVRADTNTSVNPHGDESLAESKVVEKSPVSSPEKRVTSAAASVAAKAKADEILRRHRLPRATQNVQADHPDQVTPAGGQRIRGGSSPSQTTRTPSSPEEPSKTSRSDPGLPQVGGTSAERPESVSSPSLGATARALETEDGPRALSPATLSKVAKLAYNGENVSAVAGSTDSSSVSQASGSSSSNTGHELANGRATQGSNVGSPSRARGTSPLDPTRPASGEDSTPGHSSRRASPRKIQGTRIPDTSSKYSLSPSSKDISQTTLTSTGLAGAEVRRSSEGESKALNRARRAPAHEDASPAHFLSEGWGPGRAAVERGTGTARQVLPPASRSVTSLGDESCAQRRGSSPSLPVREAGLHDTYSAFARGGCDEAERNNPGSQRDSQASRSPSTILGTRRGRSDVDDKMYADESVDNRCKRRIIDRMNGEERGTTRGDVPPSTVSPASYHAHSNEKMLTAAGSGRS